MIDNNELRPIEHHHAHIGCRVEAQAQITGRAGRKRRRKAATYWATLLTGSTHGQSRNAVLRKADKLRKHRRVQWGKFLKRQRQTRRTHHDIRIGAWNTRRLGAVHGRVDVATKLRHMAEVWQLRKWDAALLQDVTLGERGRMTFSTKKETWTIIHRGKVAIALGTKLTMAWERGGCVVHTDGMEGTCRVISVQIPCTNKRGVSLISVYVPSSEANRETVAAVYDKLGRVRERRPGGFHTIIGGDFNGEVGSRTNGEEQALGPHGHGRCNEKGRMMLDSCQAENLVVTNTWTSQKNKTTWRHPRWKSGHLIDYILVERPQLNNVKRVLTLHEEVAWTGGLTGWGEYTDHNPVEISFKIAPPQGMTAPAQRAKRWAWVAGRGDEPAAKRLRAQYAEEIRAQLTARTSPMHWDDIINVTTAAARKVFGPVEPKPPRPWLDGKEAELRRLSFAVATAKAARDKAEEWAYRQEEDEEAADFCAQAWRLVQAATRRKRRQLREWEDTWWNQLSNQAETAAARNDSRALYDLIRQLRGRAVTRGQHGGTQQPDNPVMEAQAWKEHFRRIQDGTQPVHDRIWANVVERADRATWMDEKPNQAEIQKAIKTMKLGKAPGIDGVTVEALRWAPDEMHHQLCTIIQTMWMDATSTQLGQEAHDWPEAWKTAIIVPLWKQKQPRSDKNNWRGVTLLSVGAKVVAHIVANRLQTHTEEFMDERQQGFRRNRGVDDVLQVSRRITEEVVSSGPTEPVIVGHCSTNGELEQALSACVRPYTTTRRFACRAALSYQMGILRDGG